jgi:hypothetical protein
MAASQLSEAAVAESEQKKIPVYSFIGSLLSPMIAGAATRLRVSVSEMVYFFVGGSSRFGGT